MKAENFINIDTKFINMLWRITSSHRYYFFFGEKEDIEYFASCKFKDYEIHKITVKEIVTLLQVYSQEFIDIRNVYRKGDPLPQLNDKVKYSGNVYTVTDATKKDEIVIESYLHGTKVINEDSIFEIAV